MDEREAAKPANAPVYVESSGAAVFTTICFNCHGIQADSKGLLADAISNLTGGDARVANLRDGLLGPTTEPGMNREAVFGSAAATLGLATDDLASRYVAWMTLGGTEKHLPQDVLTEVSVSRVVGKVRSHIDQQGTPDMLKLGLTLCGQIADSDPNYRQQFGLDNLTGNRANRLEQIQRPHRQQRRRRDVAATLQPRQPPVRARSERRRRLVDGRTRHSPP